jgi:uncharacterized protein involved in exopolysaccharide biosynthesis
LGQIQSLDEFLNLLSRRRWLIITVTVLGLLLSGIFAKTRPDVYEAAAVIQVEMPTVTGTDGAPASNGSAQILQTIQQRLTTREQLVAMIDRHGLFADLPALSPDKKIDLLRASIQFQTVATEGSQAFGQVVGVSAIIIYARLGNGDQAARVANDLAQGILDQSAAGQRNRTDENVTFYTEEESRLWQEISALEAEIEAYKTANNHSLPSIRDARRDELVSIEDDQRTALQEKLGLEAEMAAIQTTETLRETDRRQLAVLQSRIGVLETQISALADRHADIEADLAMAPEVDRVMGNYDRKLTLLQGQHDVVASNLAAAQTAQKLAERQKAERYTLLERAVTPEYPTGGSSKKIAVAGAMASILGAFGLAFLLDLMRPVVRTAAQMERQLDLRPVITIPELTPAKPAARGGMKLPDDPAKPLLGLPRFALFAGAATVLLLVAAAAIS